MKNSIVKIRDVVQEMDVVSDEHYPYINKITGELITISQEEIRIVEEGNSVDEYPDWQQELIQQASRVLECDDFLLLPNKFEIHEYSIMESFCYSIGDTDIRNELISQIRGSGAFRRFNDVIYRYELVDNWYYDRLKALEKIAIN